MKTKILIVGITGKMGKELIKASKNFKKIEIAKGISSTTILQNFDTYFKNCDVVIDFSNTKLLEKFLPFCIKHKKPLICGTTGFDENQKKSLQLASKKIPIFYATNFSLGMNILNQIAEIIAKNVTNTTNIEIIETHHKEKKDKPSGSAKTLKEKILEHKPTCQINIESKREANVVGEHIINFTAIEEQISIKHIAFDRIAFAKGALFCVDFIKNKKHGFFSINDLLQ